ncbi:MAG: hypothetical protein HZA54_11050 [Planctomycetes bacterium]|nr:hypothetical protein [Planctomycetota bacterium]
MRFYAGKLLELVGILLVGVALLYGIAQDSMKLELYLGGIGGGLFVLGWWSEGRARAGDG